MLSCSTCGQPFRIDETPTPPFCSERCQLIDMGRWLDEEISVPHEGGNSDVMGGHRDSMEDQEEDDGEDDEANG
ncbi:MAG: DNA gyrase inhibitor YacG [Rubripirellula sp.]